MHKAGVPATTMQTPCMSVSYVINYTDHTFYSLYDGHSLTTSHHLTLDQSHGEPVDTRIAASRRSKSCGSAARRTSATPTAGKLRITLLASSKLTAQMFTTAAQLLDLTDSETPLGPALYQRQGGEDRVTDSSEYRSKPTEKLVLVLRDGRKLIGVLRSWDQFGTD